MQWKHLIFGVTGEPLMSQVEPGEYAYTFEYYRWFWENLGK